MWMSSLAEWLRVRRHCQDWETLGFNGEHSRAPNCLNS